MNSLPLQYSEYGEIDTPENKKKRNHTYKNKKRYNAKVKDFLKTMEGDDDNLVDFKSSNVVQSDNIPKRAEDNVIEEDNQLNDEAVTQQYYKQYLPYYTSGADSQSIK